MLLYLPADKLARAASNHGGCVGAKDNRRRSARAAIGRVREREPVSTAPVLDAVPEDVTFRTTVHRAGFTSLNTPRFRNAPTRNQRNLVPSHSYL